MPHVPPHSQMSQATQTRGTEPPELPPCCPTQVEQKPHLTSLAGEDLARVSEPFLTTSCLEGALSGGNAERAAADFRSTRRKRPLTRPFGQVALPPSWSSKSLYGKQHLPGRDRSGVFQKTNILPRTLVLWTTAAFKAGRCHHQQLEAQTRLHGKTPMSR